MIVGSKSTILIFSPWYDPGVLKRTCLRVDLRLWWIIAIAICFISGVWCLYEIMVCLKNSSQLEIAMSKQQSEAFIMTSNSFQTVGNSVRHLDAKKATATHLSDREMVFRKIQQMEGGVAKLNDTVKDNLIQWSTDQYKKKADQMAAHLKDSKNDDTLVFEDKCWALKQAQQYEQRTAPF